MLFILRQIRRQLMEKSKTTTYLLYAIGEIALVVIGILIALQVNNWNERKKDKALAQSIYQSLREEAKSNAVAH